MVADAGLEPASPNGREILSLVCIPVPPISHVYNVTLSDGHVNVILLVLCQRNVSAGGAPWPPKKEGLL